MTLSLISQIRAHAAASPSSMAVASRYESLDYRTLELRSNRLAAALRRRGLQAGSLAAIVMERSTDFVVAALAIWKAGAAYVPVDPGYPAERVESILRDSDASLVLTTRATRPEVDGLSERLVIVNDLEGDASDAILAADTDEHSLAYVIYTSGSTGTPNGVEVTHANLAHLCEWHVLTFGVSAADRAPFAASPGFDAAVWEIWPYLAAGASLHLPDDVTRRSPELLRDWLVAQRITIAFAPTPIAEGMLELEWPAGTSLRTMLTGADTLHRFPQAGLPFTLVNNYGPTECTVVSTSGAVPSAAAGRPTIGRPLPYCDIRILDDNRSPVPAGTEGEIYIGGAGVARGYRNRPELTAARFVRGCFKTGDRGRLLPNGEIEFLGRTDDQVKIRGYRVELGEVVAALNRHPGIRANAVVLDEAGRLVAYVVGRSLDVREFLRTKLPEYAIPEVFIELEELPVTAHGKVDRGRLPRVRDGGRLQTGPQVENVPHLAMQVCGVLGELLHRPAVSLDDNFFLLGGHSLLGTQLIVRLRDLFGVDLNLLTLFDNPTARSLSTEIERLLSEQLDSMTEAELSGLIG